MLNKNYGKRKQDGSIEYAPRKFVENGNIFVPRIDDDQAYALRGWLKIIDIKPEYDLAKKMLSLVRWTEDLLLMTLTAQYEIVDIPKPTTRQVRRFSKLKLVEFCMEKGIWQELKTFLDGTGYYDLFVMAVFFLENDKFFMQGLQAFRQHKAQDPEYDADVLQKLIQQALAYAFDSYETVPVEHVESQQQ